MEPKHLLKLEFQPAALCGSRARRAPGLEDAGHEACLPFGRGPVTGGVR
jgi:hypothetical protein